MEQRLYEALQSNPIIAAVRDDEGLEACLQADVQTVFVLGGSRTRERSPSSTRI